MKLARASLVVIFMMFNSAAALAGFEMVCEGHSSQSNARVISVNCADRNSFIEALRTGWQLLRANNIGGTLENLCWEAYNQARDMHPSISFRDISDAFLMRCNVGLEYVR
jgi:hypothetical protein